MGKAIAGGIMMLIGIGLILRFGGTSNTILYNAEHGIIGETNALSLSGFPGNQP